MIVEWVPITETNRIPPFGAELSDHIASYKNALKRASCSVWCHLYNTLQSNGFPIPTVSFSATGKPCFLDSPICFSLSHTRGLCAVAISDRPVGVDIEIRKSGYPCHLVERSLCEAEKNVYDGDFTRIWCRKEAVAKMTGEGITGYPAHIDTTGYAFHEELIDYEGKSYWLAAVEQSIVS